ncbi:SlyX family protein [Orbus sturtevantii]|uniref:SlyX family protein n=1 Tax=Orbus sturtevantii TaxID=3074109 RepID=UPI00370D9B1E
MNKQQEYRLEQLETKISFQEITIEELNKITIQLQAEIARLKEQLSLLSKKLQASQPSNIANISEEVPPPHY